MPFKLLQSLKSINKINDRPPLCSCCSVVRLQQPYKENGQYSVKASCARGHCLLYSVLTCWYKFQGFNPGCGSSVVAGEAQRSFQIRVRVKYNVRSFCCYSNTMALLLTYTYTHIHPFIFIYKCIRIRSKRTFGKQKTVFYTSALFSRHILSFIGYHLSSIKCILFNPSPTTYKKNKMFNFQTRSC